VGSREWGVGECRIIYLDSIVPIQPETISKKPILSEVHHHKWCKILREFTPETYNNHPYFAPWTHALIDRVARVSVCCMMPNKPIIGDLRQQSFKEIWTGENFAALRQTKNFPMFENCQKFDRFLENNRRLAKIVYS